MRYSVRFPKTVVLLVLAILASQSILFAQSQTLYLPVLQATDAASLGVALSNPTLSETTVMLTARGREGQIISGQGITNPASLIIPASGQRALQPVEIFGSGISGKTGWVEILSPIPEVKGFFLVFDAGLNFIDGAELVSKSSNRLVFPKVSVTRDSETNVTLVNTGPSRFTTVVTLIDNSGSLVARNSLAIEPFSVLSGPVTNFVQVGTGFDGYATVEGGVGNGESLVGFETYRNRSDVALLLGVPQSATLRTGFAAHLATQAGYQTRVALVNNSARAQIAEITADGLSVGGQSRTPASVTVQRTIPAYGRLEEKVDEMFGLSGSALIAGYIRFKVQADTQGLIGYVDYGTTDGTLLAAVPVQGTTGFSDLYFSHIAEGAGYYTGLAFLNPSTEPSSVTIDVFSRDGSRVGSSAIVLAPGERRSRLIPELIPSLTTQLGGSVHVTASQPIFASQLFGSREGLTFLANVSGQGVQLQPQSSGDRVAADTGATVIAAGGYSVSIAIPPGALRASSVINLSPVKFSTLPVPPGAQKIIGAVDAWPSATQFKIPAKLRFPLSAQFIPQTTLELLVLNPSSNQFEPSGSMVIVDESGRTASADITHLSMYAVGMPTDRLINVSNISPTSGRPGTTVSIDGTGFSSIASQNIVTFAGKANTSVPATVTAATTISLTAIVPGEAVSGDVIVNVGDRSSVGVPFKVIRDNPGPYISSISPATVDYGTTSVDIQISGANFLTDSTVIYDGAAVSSGFVNSTMLRIRASDIQLNPGIHRILVSNPSPGGGESNTAEFGVTSPVPVISNLSPNAAFRGYPTEVTITGSGFTPSSVVLLDGVAASRTFVDTTTLKVTALGLEPGVIRIAVSNPAPGGGISSNAVFQVLEPPSGSGLSIVAPLTLDKTTVGIGGTLNATVAYMNTGGSAITVNRIVIAGRSPGGTNSGGPYEDFSPELGRTTVEPGAMLQVSASRRFTSADPLGTWYTYVTYQDTSRVWHDGPRVSFTVLDNANNVGVLSLSATFENISVRAAFFNDPNANNTPRIQFRKQGDGAWKNALNPIPDRRARVAGTTNPYFGQVRGSIVGLTPGTTYEVAVQSGDPNGVSSPSKLTGTVTTLASAPPLSTRQIVVDDVDSDGDGSSTRPFNSIRSALNAATPGDTIVVRPGTYAPFTVSKSGTASGYIAIVGESRDEVFISGGSGDSIDVNGNYIQLKNLRLKLPGHNGIAVDGYHHVWLENIYIEDLYTRNYYDAGVFIKNANDVYVLNSQIYAPSLTALPAANPRWESTGEGIFVGAGVRNLVVRGNTIIGGYLDCIGNSPEGWGGAAMDNSDIAYNTISGCKDDGIQMDGEDVNLRIYGNVVTANNGYSALSMAPHLVGPVYVFRNVFRVTWNGGTGYAFKLNDSPGFSFYIHNTIDTTGSNRDHDGWEDVGPNDFIFNNIIKTNGYSLRQIANTAVLNGNLYFRAGTGPIVRNWNDSSDYYTVAAFWVDTGEEQQGRQGDPGFIDAAAHISTSSPAFDAGILIPNFNDAESAWPFKGGAPDIGAFEVP